MFEIKSRRHVKFCTVSNGYEDATRRGLKPNGLSPTLNASRSCAAALNFPSFIIFDQHISHFAEDNDTIDQKLVNMSLT